MIFGVFTPEQFQRLQEALLLATDAEIGAVLGLVPAEAIGASSAELRDMVPAGPSLRAIIEDYQHAAAMWEKVGGAEKHKSRLEAIEATATRLKQLLETEPLMLEIEMGRVTQGVPAEIRAGDAREAASDRTSLLDELDELACRAGELARDKAWLRQARSDRPSGKAQRDLERTHLWEPVFRLWTLAGRKIAATRGGDMFRFLTVIHESLGIPAPKEESVYKAIQAYNRSVDL